MTHFSKEIQGLRAIAVLSVLLFHFGVNSLDGGYLGVEIFFVISGYLIGSIILESIKNNQFSLLDFYKNRAVRLFPNLLLMLIAATILAWILLKPYDFFQFGKSLQFSGLYVTNIVFSKQQGYFDISREVKPLLHTWSLSIEEQFYLFLPIFLILIRGISLRNRITLIFSIIIISFLYKTWLIHALPINSFFSFPGRIWELGLGVFFASLPTNIKEKFQGRNIIASLAISILCIYLIFLKEDIYWAGIISLGCCVSTGLLILSSPNTWVGKLLSTRVMTYFGNISYSLYLWHWLVLVWVKNNSIQLSHMIELVVLLGLSILLAHLAWKYVELPLRNKKEFFTRKQVFISVFLFTSLTAAAGGFIYAKNGFPERFPKYVKVSKNIESFNWEKSTGSAPSSSSECSLNKKSAPNIDQCALGDHNAKKSVLVIGDSHAASLKTAFDIAGQKEKVKVIIAVGPGCPPILGIKSFNGADNICEKINFDENLKKILDSKKFDQVYLVAYWDMYARGSRLNGRLLRPTHFISNDLNVANNPTESQLVINQSLKETITFINKSGAEVILVQDVPTLPKAIQDLPDHFKLDLAELHSQQLFIKEFLFKETNPLLKTINLADAVCNNEACHTIINNNYLYNDSNHLSPAGASLTIPLIRQSLKK